MIREGKPERFALEFDLVVDPDVGGEAVLRASWGQLRIWVGGRNLTAGSSPNGVRLDCAECPLLPIAEWFVEHWNPMLHEERFPTSLEATSSANWYIRILDELGSDDEANDILLESRQAWWNDHGLGAALPGYRIPDIHFRRFGERIEISWDDSEWRSVPSGIVLAELPGVMRLPVGEVVDVLERSCRRLLEMLAKTSATAQATHLLDRLKELGSSTCSLDRLRYAAGQKIERMASNLRKRAGVVGGSLQETIRALLGSSNGAPSYYAELTVPVLLFRSAAPDLSDDDLNALLSLCDKAFDRAMAPDFLRVRKSIACPLSREETTSQGYALALELRRVLGIPESAALLGEHDIELLLRERLGVSIIDCPLSDEGIEGAALLRPGRAPVIAINPVGRCTQTSWGRRMTLGHEVCHILHDGESDDALVGIVSNEWAPYLIERRANAFAAMLLAPERAIERVLDRHPNLWTDKDLHRAMRELGIGATTLLQQLRNLRWLRSDRQRDHWLNVLSA